MILAVVSSERSKDVPPRDCFALTDRQLLQSLPHGSAVSYALCRVLIGVPQCTGRSWEEIFRATVMLWLPFTALVPRDLEHVSLGLVKCPDTHPVQSRAQESVVRDLLSQARIAAHVDQEALHAPRAFPVKRSDFVVVVLLKAHRSGSPLALA
jgi:hypothetical protein